MSLSSRRAWIEMNYLQMLYNLYQSLSSRRAWIEMEFKVIDIYINPVSLSSRRAWIEINSDVT